MIRIQYDRSKLRLRLISFQIIPMLLTYHALAMTTGVKTPKSATVASLAILLGFVLYAIIMRHMLLALKEPTLLSIDADRTLRWRPGFKIFEARLPPGSRVSVGEGHVTISPRVPNMPVARSEDFRTVVRLPQGLKSYEQGEIVLP